MQPTQFQLELITANHNIELRLSGRLDAMETLDFHSVMRQYLNQNTSRHVLLDLEGLEYIDSSGIGALLVLNSRLGSEQGSLTLRNCRGDVMNAIKLLNLHKMLRVE